MARGGFLCDCTFWDERGGGLTRQPVSPQADNATITTVMSTHRVDSGGFSSRCCAFRRTHTSADPITATLYPNINSFALDSLLALTICAQRKTHGWCFTPDPMACVFFFVRLHVLGREERRTYWATDGPIGGHSNHHNSNERKSRGLGEVWLTMLCVPGYTHERRPYSATLYPTSFTLDFLLALAICAQRKTHGWCFTLDRMCCGAFSRDCMFRDERRG